MHFFLHFQLCPDKVYGTWINILELFFSPFIVILHVRETNHVIDDFELQFLSIPSTLAFNELHLLLPTIRIYVILVQHRPATYN